MKVKFVASRRRGFTILEMALAAFLMVFASMLLANAWSSFGRPAVSAIARGRLAQEANLAAEALAHDVGRLAIADPASGNSRYQNVQALGSSLEMMIDDGTGSAQTVTYALDPNNPGKLLRSDANSSRVVAYLVSDFASARASLPLGEDEAMVSGVQIQLTLTHRTYDRDRDGSFRGDHTRLYTLFVPDPLP